MREVHASCLVQWNEKPSFFIPVERAGQYVCLLFAPSLPRLEERALECKPHFFIALFPSDTALSSSTLSIERRRSR